MYILCYITIIDYINYYILYISIMSEDKYIVVLFYFIYITYKIYHYNLIKFIFLVLIDTSNFYNTRLFAFFFFIYIIRIRFINTLNRYNKTNKTIIIIFLFFFLLQSLYCFNNTSIKKYRHFLCNFYIEKNFFFERSILKLLKIYN